MSILRSALMDRAGDPSAGADGAPAAALDMAAALDRVGGDEELLRELAALFLDDYPREVQLIREAIASEDWKTAEREAHGVKGAVANFGADDAVEAARAVEFAAREGRHAELPALFERMQAELARARIVLDRIAGR